MPDDRIRPDEQKRRQRDEADEPRPRPRRDDDEFDERPMRRRRDEDDGSGGGIFPYKNGMALAAYYCGIFGLIPGVGLALAPLAVIFGIIGLVKARGDKFHRGMGHAIAGILLGLVVGPAVWVGILFLFKYAT